MSLSTFLTESVESEQKLKHLEHAEDHIINSGEEGFAHAFHNLNDVHEKLKGGDNKTTVLVKHDGSPSIIFGTNPENGRFFVASKSAFNKEPKINYTPGDIEKNHGHAPGLVEKLKAALKHLPKVAPKAGIYQGDLMYTKGDVEDKGGRFSFKPNVITYSAAKHSGEGKKIAKAHLGVLVHTSYSGRNIDSMRADYTPDLKHFGEHDDVHLFNNHQDFKKTKYTPEQQAEFEKHMKAATQQFASSEKGTFRALEGHQEMLKTYINSTVRDSSKPSVNGYRNFLKQRFVNEIGKLKSPKAIDKRVADMQANEKHITKNAEGLGAVLSMHHHIQKAKDVLTHALSSHQVYRHTINDQPTKPEGFVVVKNNRPTKFVDRAEFSRANFAARDKS